MKFEKRKQNNEQTSLLSFRKRSRINTSPGSSKRPYSSFPPYGRGRHHKLIVSHLFIEHAQSVTTDIDKFTKYLRVDKIWPKSTSVTETGRKMCPVISSKVVGKIVHATIPKGNMGYDLYTVSDDLYLSNLLLLLSFSTRKHMSVASPAIPSNFFVEQ